MEEKQARLGDVHASRRGYDGVDGSVAANGGLRAAYGGDAVGWAARVGSLGPWACSAWRRGIGRGRRCGGCRIGGRSGASASGPSQGRGSAVWRLPARDVVQERVPARNHFRVALFDCCFLQKVELKCTKV
jgi:hypothetical protein